MQTLYGRQFDSKNNTVVALGSFDALHIAHKKLIDTARDYADKNKLDMLVYTFRMRPENVLVGGDIKNILSLEQKARMLEAMGADYVCFDEFDEEFSHLSAKDFSRMLTDTFNMRCAVVGFNYRFGHNGLGDVELLKELGYEMGFDVIVIDPVCIDSIVVSSTHIRGLLEEGRVDTAAEFLGRPFGYTGRVVRDRGVGSGELGVPTANVIMESVWQGVRYGVYAATVNADGRCYRAVCNVGIRPTYMLDTPVAEVHILDETVVLDNKVISIELIKMIRDEVKFENSQQLKCQIFSDIDKAKEILKNFV